MTEKRKPINWPPIAEEYIAGIKTVRQLSEEFGVPDSTIRHRAKRHNWIRTAKHIKAKKVSASIAKADKVKETMSVSKTYMTETIEVDESNVARLIEEAVNQDVKDMNLGLANSRKALIKAGIMIDALEADGDPRLLKSLADTTKSSIETIRKVRGLDEVENKADDLSEWSEDQLREELDRLTN